MPVAVHRRVRAWLLSLCLVPAIASAQPAADGFDPIGPDGWPKAITVADVRGLPECGPEGLSHVPGAALTCRPPIVARGPQFAVGLDWTSGGVFGDVPTLGGAHALGVDLDFALGHHLVLGARYELMGIAVPASTELSNQFFGMLKLRLWSDEVARRAWTFGLGGGYALRGEALGGSAPIVRASLARELGMYVGETGAVNAIGELAYERSTGPMALSAVLASVRLGFEANIRQPENLGDPAPSPWRHTTDFGWIVGPFLGFDLGVGVRANERLSLETDGAFLFDYHQDDSMEHGFDGASWSLATGPRLQLGWPWFAPFYVQAQAGAAWVAQQRGGELRPIAQGEVGFRALIGCASGADLGFWLRGDLDGARGVTAGGAVLRVVFGSGRGAAGGEREDCGGDAPRLATPYVPPPPPQPQTTVEISAPSLPEPPAVDVHVDVHANVQAEVHPIVIDVALGASLGPLRVAIDPRVLPLAQVRGAGFVQVELSGPADALASFRAQLSATLGRSGARVDAWSAVATRSSVVRAKFTIWPPGSRP